LRAYRAGHHGTASWPIARRHASVRADVLDLSERSRGFAL